MIPIFVDTSFFVALVDTDDQFNGHALKFLRKNKAPLFSSSAIVLELGAYFAQQRFRSGFFASLNAIEKSKIEIVHVDEPLQRRAIAFFKARSDKDWSLADCISFLLMQERGIAADATSDAHFQQAGFIALLRQPASN